MEEDLRRTNIGGWRMETQVQKDEGGLCERPRYILVCSARMMMMMMMIISYL